MEDKERNPDRERQPQQKIGRRKSGRNRGRIEQQEFVFEERQQAEVEGDSDRKPDRARSPCQDQKQIGAEHRDREHRQQFHLSVTVEEQARQHQQVDLKGPGLRQIIDRKNNRNKQPELPRSKGHAAPFPQRRTLASPPIRAHPLRGARAGTPRNDESSGKKRRGGMAPVAPQLLKLAGPGAESALCQALRGLAGDPSEVTALGKRHWITSFRC